MVDWSGLLVSLLTLGGLAVLVATYWVAVPALAWLQSSVPQWLALATGLLLFVFLTGFVLGRYK